MHTSPIDILLVTPIHIMHIYMYSIQFPLITGSDHSSEVVMQ